MGLVSMWEHLSHAVMGFSARPEQSAAAAELDASLRHVFPDTHGAISRTDREALVRRQICKRQDLSRLMNNDGISSALPDVSASTRDQLYHGSSKCSVRDAIEEPMASLPERRPVNILSEVSAPIAHTIEQKHSWPNFADQAQQLCDNLDDARTLYKGNLPTAATHDWWQGYYMDVHSACSEQLRFIDNVAERSSNITSRIESAGGARCFTHVPFRVRDERAAAQSLAGESAACTSAVVKILTSGDLQVERGDTWDMILADKDKLKRIEPALQQVFACAIEEEVAVAAVTSYEVTFFIKRSMDVTEKRIWVSDPVWCDQIRPSARACWLNFMHHAQLTYPAKASLARELVPFTGPGVRLQMRCKEAVRSSRKRARDSACPPPSTERPNVPELPYSIAFADLNQTAVVYRSPDRPVAILKEGKTHGVRTIIKTFNGSDQNAIDMYGEELKNYCKLKELQGLHIPRLLFWGPLQDGFNSTLVLEHCGVSLEKLPSLTRQHKQAARRALRALHSKGAVHGYIHESHLVWNANEKRVILIDLATISYKGDASFSEDLYYEKVNFKAMLEEHT